MRKIIYTVLGLVLILKLSELYVAQPWLNDQIEASLKDKAPTVTTKSIEFSGANMLVKQLAFSAMPDPIDIKGTLTADLFGKPTIHVDLVPSGSQLWHADRLTGRIVAWFDKITLMDGVISNFYVLDAPKMVLPKIEFQADHHLDLQRTFIDILIPQFGGGVSGAKLKIKGEINHADDHKGNFTVTLINPAAVIDFLAEAKLLKKQQLAAVKGLVSGGHGAKAEISLPLTLEKGALYLGPIRLYPRSSKEDTLARIADVGVASLFRSFGKALQ